MRRSVFPKKKSSPGLSGKRGQILAKLTEGFLNILILKTSFDSKRLLKLKNQQLKSRSDLDIWWLINSVFGYVVVFSVSLIFFSMFTVLEVWVVTMKFFRFFAWVTEA